MENKDYRESIGKRLEEALKEEDFADLEDLIEMPSKETFYKWVEEADERREKKFYARRKAMSLCAVFAITIALIALAIAIKGFAVPDVEADPKQDRNIEDSMETTATYTAWSELPEDIKAQFFEFTAFPEGYEVESINVKERITFTKVVVKATSGENYIEVRQKLYRDGTLDSNAVSAGTYAELWGDTEVNVNLYDDNIKEATYSCVINNNVIDITASKTIQKELIQTLTEKAVR